MNDSTYNILLPLFKEFVFYTGFGLFMISLITGLALLVKPDLIIMLNKKVGMKFSLRRSMKFAESPNSIDRIFYRHHKLIGFIVAITSVYVLYYFAIIYDAVLFAEVLKTSKYAVALDLLVSSLRLFMLICGAVILLLGITIFFRPSKLKSIEAWANRWVSTRRATRQLSVEREQINQLVYKYPRTIGLFIVILSLYASMLLILVYTG